MLWPRPRDCAVWSKISWLTEVSFVSRRGVSDMFAIAVYVGDLCLFEFTPIKMRTLHG